MKTCIATMERLRLEATRLREEAWDDVRPLIQQRRYAEAARRMRQACREAWQLEKCAQ